MCVSIFKPKYIVCMFLLKLPQICNFSKVTRNCYVTDNSYIQNIHTFQMFPYDGFFSIAYIITNDGITNSIHV